MPHKDAEARRRYHREWSAKNKITLRAYHKEWRKSHPKQLTANSYKAKLLYRFGITPEQYANLLHEQGGVCAICGEAELDGKKLAIDHDHRTGEIRGLLCSRCNTALGGFRDNPSYLSNAILYLIGQRSKGARKDIEVDRRISRFMDLLAEPRISSTPQ